MTRTDLIIQSARAPRRRRLIRDRHHLLRWCLAASAAALIASASPAGGDEGANEPVRRIVIGATGDAPAQSRQQDQPAVSGEEDELTRIARELLSQLREQGLTSSDGDTEVIGDGDFLFVFDDLPEEVRGGLIERFGQEMMPALSERVQDLITKDAMLSMLGDELSGEDGQRVHVIGEEGGGELAVESKEADHPLGRDSVGSPFADHTKGANGRPGHGGRGGVSPTVTPVISMGAGTRGLSRFGIGTSGGGGGGGGGRTGFSMSGQPGRRIVISSRQGLGEVQGPPRNGSGRDLSPGNNGRRNDPPRSSESPRVNGRNLGEPGYVLTPGRGFTGVTRQPGPVGRSGDLGYDAKAIARWDAVPYRTIFSEELGVEEFAFGVVAFHIAGIDRVEFSANGGEWIPVNSMGLNPRTNVWEYYVTFRAPDLEDGKVEVRAVIWPKVGHPRVLQGALSAESVDLGEHSMFFYANGGASFNRIERYVSPNGDDRDGDGSRLHPYESIAKAACEVARASQGGVADNGVVYLLPGEHKWGPAERDAGGNYIGRPAINERFLTVAAAPGMSPGQVRLVRGGSGGLKIDLLHVRNLTWSDEISNAVSSGAEPILWVEDCQFVGSGRTDTKSWTPTTGWTGGAFVTDSAVRNARYGFSGACALVRNGLVTGTGDDAFINPKMLLNCRVDDVVVPPGSGYHSDIVQMHASEKPVRNRIIYGLRATNSNAQAWHVGYTGHRKGPDWEDLAFVNILFEAEEHTHQWIPSANHVLWWHLTFVEGPVIIRNNPDAGYGHGEICNIRNFSMRNCVFDVFSLREGEYTPAASDDSWAARNHFMDVTTHGAIAVGTDPTTGGSLHTLFENPSGDDFSPRSLSPLRRRVRTPVVNADLVQQELESPAAIGALQRRR